MPELGFSGSGNAGVSRDGGVAGAPGHTIGTPPLTARWRGIRMGFLLACGGGGLGSARGVAAGPPRWREKGICCAGAG